MTDLKLGKKDPKNHKALRLAPLLTGVAVSHPPAVDHLNIGGWQMLGNDRYGDCVAVTWANYRRLLTRLVGKETYPGMQAVTAIYETQNPGFPGQDDGMEIQTLLEYLQKQGQIIAFARVDHTNLDEVDAAIAIFGGVWTGIQVTQQNMDEFDAGKPWTYSRTSPNLGGHSIITGGYNPSTQRFVSWARETDFTQSFWTHQVDEAWVVVWPENLGTPQFEQGIDLSALAADFKALTGRELPLPTPEPAPVPVKPPAPVPSALDEGLWDIVGGWAKAKHYTAITKRVAAALLVWAKNKGLE